MSLCEVPGCTASAQYPKIDGQPNAIRARWCDRHALERSLSQSRRDTVPLTKQDIDALVDGMPYDGPPNIILMAARESRAMLKRSLYLAAGLTATGERKPERVRCFSYNHLTTGETLVCPVDAVLRPRDSDITDIVFGYFIPDGDADAR